MQTSEEDEDGGPPASEVSSSLILSPLPRLLTRPAGRRVRTLVWWLSGKKKKRQEVFKSVELFRALFSKLNKPGPLIRKLFLQVAKCWVRILGGCGVIFWLSRGSITWPNISQFYSLKIRRQTNLILFRNVTGQISML